MMIQNQMSDVTVKLNEYLTGENRMGRQQEKSCLLKRDRVCSSCGAADLIPAGSCFVCRNCGVSNDCG